MPFVAFLSILSALFAALANVSARYVMGFVQTRDYLSVNFVMLVLVTAIVLPFDFWLVLTPLSLVVILVASLIDSAANFCYFKAFELEEAGTASALMALGPFFSLATLPLFASTNKTAITPVEVIGVVMITGGVGILHRPKKNPAGSDTQPAANPTLRLLMPIGSAFFFGINVHILKYLFSEQMTNPVTYYFIRSSIALVLVTYLSRPNLSWVTPPRLLIILGRAALVVAKWMLMLYAMVPGNPAVVKALSEITPLFVLVLSFVLLREPITPAKVLGSLTIIAGVVLLTLPVSFSIF